MRSEVCGGVGEVKMAVGCSRSWVTKDITTRLLADSPALDLHSAIPSVPNIYNGNTEAIKHRGPGGTLLPMPSRVRLLELRGRKDHEPPGWHGHSS